MKFAIVMTLFLSLFLSACGKDNKSSGSSNVLSSDPLHASTVDGYLLNDGRGTLQINGQYYQMVSNLSGSQIAQQLNQSGVQPTQINGVQAFRAHLTGYLYNPCGNNQSCGYQSQMFNVSAIQFF